LKRIPKLRRSGEVVIFERIEASRAKGEQDCQLEKGGIRMKCLTCGVDLKDVWFLCYGFTVIGMFIAFCLEEWVF
jgi:hypothetical protein